MSSTPESRTHEVREENATSQGNSFASSLVLSLVLFVMFVAGLWVMGLYTIAWWWFGVGLVLCIVSLFLAFDLVPRLLAK
ncbi:hypothetical protein Bequi_00485 [Brachybacterium sp. JHP9]|uniref:Uncharacterized protein n=1 Tax=Brachybacterium equifaecis TaxID=2910770 RepID=A0ABT0QW32_9MICO|nr:hypothetical protein [Brachybacterium equifaecis]MCL6421873.1 hypothetical protein [Brachybacterium equifaecis]